MDDENKPDGEESQEDETKDSITVKRAHWKCTSTGVVPPPALLDKLTGLPNRRYLESALHSNLEELRRYERGFGVLLFDIDNFREVNNLLGRQIGDKVLRSVGKLLNKRTRPFDIVGRAGGEEFLATIAEVSAEKLQTVAEKLRKSVEEMEILTTSDSLRVTVSVGGTLATPDDTKEVLIKRAYRLMRKSKNRGRNCVNVGSD
jgi:diguanylate cyclase (GGDEF)-like protein